MHGSTTLSACMTESKSSVNRGRRRRRRTFCHFVSLRSPLRRGWIDAVTALTDAARHASPVPPLDSQAGARSPAASLTSESPLVDRHGHATRSDQRQRRPRTLTSTFRPVRTVPARVVDHFGAPRLACCAGGRGSTGRSRCSGGQEGSCQACRWSHHRQDGGGGRRCARGALCLRTLRG